MEFHHYASPSLPPLQSLTNSFSSAAQIPSPPSTNSSLSLHIILYIVAACVISVGIAIVGFCTKWTKCRSESPPVEYVIDTPPLNYDPWYLFNIGPSLPEFRYSKETNCQKDCAICLVEFQEEERVKTIPFCKHIYHPQCLVDWMLYKRMCPICRSTQLYPEGEGPEPPQLVMQPGASAQGSPSPTIPTQVIDLSQCQNQESVHQSESPESSDETVPAQGTLAIDLSQFQEQGTVHDCARPASSDETVPAQGTLAIELSQFQEQGSVHHCARPEGSDETVPAQGTLAIDLNQFQEQGSVHHCARPASSNEIVPA